MDAVFHVIDKTTWERAIYFDYYYHQIKCKYNLTVNIDITRLMRRKKERNLKFFPKEGTESEVLSDDAVCHHESGESE